MPTVCSRVALIGPNEAQHSAARVDMILSRSSPTRGGQYSEQRMAFAKRAFLVGFVVFFMAVVLLGVFSPSTPRVFLNQRRAVESIRELNRAEYNYAAGHPNAGFACNFSDLREQGSEPLPRVGLVDRVLLSGTKSSYHFEIQCLQSGSKKVAGYTITALPVEPGATGKYAFCTNQGGEIWYRENGLAADCLATQKPIERKYR